MAFTRFVKPPNIGHHSSKRIVYIVGTLVLSPLHSPLQHTHKDGIDFIKAMISFRFPSWKKRKCFIFLSVWVGGFFKTWDNFTLYFSNYWGFFVTKINHFQGRFIAIYQSHRRQYGFCISFSGNFIL